MDLVAVGVIWARITLEADSRHASSADRGSNPIEDAYPVIAALHGLEAELNADPEPEVAELDSRTSSTSARCTRATGPP